MAEGFQEQGHIQSGMRKEKKRTEKGEKNRRLEAGRGQEGKGANRKKLRERERGLPWGVPFTWFL